MVEKTKALRIIFVGLLVLTLILMLVLIVCGISFIITSRDEDVEITKDSKLYRYLRYDPQNSKSSAGFMHLLNDLGDDNFMTYTDNEALILVSDFGSTEYKCTGSCVCEESINNDRRIAIPIVNSLIYLVAAVSSVVAYNLAKDYFEKSCVEELKNTCTSRDSIIRSEIEECEEANPVIIDYDLDDLLGLKKAIEGETAEIDFENKNKEDILPFECTANCVGICPEIEAKSHKEEEFDGLSMNEVIEKYQASYEKFHVDSGGTLKSRTRLEKWGVEFGDAEGCEFMTFTARVEIPASEFEDLNIGKTEEEYFNHVKYRFLTKDLDFVCREWSNDVGVREKDELFFWRFPMCSGYSQRIHSKGLWNGNPDELNPSVKCIKRPASTMDDGDDDVY